MILFSIPAHECLICLEKQIQNISYKIPNSQIVIFLSLNDNFYSNIEYITNKYKNIFINTESRDTFWGDCFYQHYANYKYISKLGVQYDYWVFEASNSIILKNNLSDYLYGYDALATSERGSGISPYQTNFKIPFNKKWSWWNNNFYKDACFMKLIKEEKYDIYTGYIEGMVYKKDILDAIHQILDKYNCNDYRKKNYLTYPREELYYSTIFFNLFADKCRYNHTYCNLYSNINSLEYILKSFPGFFAVKPWPRDPTDSVHIKHNEIAKMGFDAYFNTEKNNKIKNNQIRFKFSIDFLINKIFTYKNKHQKLGSIQFIESGDISLYNHPNEKKWRIDESGDLHVLAEDGRISTIFYAKDAKANTFYGDFWHVEEPNSYQWHMLELETSI